MLELPTIQCNGQFTPPEAALIKLALNQDTVGRQQYHLTSLLAVAALNGLDYFLLSHLYDLQHTIPTHLLKKLKLYDELVERSTVLVAELCREAEARKLQLLTIKTFLRFPYADHDLDVVAVHGADLEEYEKLMVYCGWVYKPSRSELREPNKRFYYPSDQLIHRIGTKTLKIHLHRALSWNGVTYLDADAVWQRHESITVRGRSIPIPSSEDEVLIMAAHAVHENRYVLLGEILQFVRLATLKELDWTYIRQVAKHFHWERALTIFLAIVKGFLQDVSDAWGALDEQAQGMMITDGSHSLICTRRLPIFLPYWQVTSAYMNKLRCDVGSKRVRVWLRELMAYTLIDWYTSIRTVRRSRLHRISQR